MWVVWVLLVVNEIELSVESNGKTFFWKTCVFGVWYVGVRERASGCQDSILLCYQIIIPITNTENRWIRNAPLEQFCSDEVRWIWKNGKNRTMYICSFMSFYVECSHKYHPPSIRNVCTRRTKAKEKKKKFVSTTMFAIKQHNDSSMFVDTYVHCTLYSGAHTNKKKFLYYIHLQSHF